MLIFCKVGPKGDRTTGWLNVHDFIQAGYDRLVKEQAGALVSLIEINGEGCKDFDKAGTKRPQYLPQNFLLFSKYVAPAVFL